MTVPVITPLPPAPTRADAPSDFTAKADTFVAAQVGMVAEFNASAEFVDQRATDADASAQAAAASEAAVEADRAQVASNAEAVASNTATVVARADEVAANTLQVASNTQQVAANTQAVADALASIADGPVTSVNGKTGVVSVTALELLPSLEGNALRGLVVNGDGSGVEWGDIGQKVGDILLTARNPGSTYLQANGSIYLQSVYPALFAAIGLVGGDIAAAFAYDKQVIASSTNTINAIDTDGSGVWILGTDGAGARRSTDNGVTWAASSVGFSNIQSLKTDKKGVWIAVGRASGSNVYRSIDNGLTWTAVSAGLSSLTDSVIDTDGKGTWVVLQSGQSSIRRSTDNGLTWASVAIGVSGATIRLSTDKNGVWIAAVASGVQSRSADNGATWAQISGGIPGVGLLCAIKGSPGGVWVAKGAETSSGARSEDGGITWTPITIGVPNTASFAFGGYIECNSSGIWLVASDNTNPRLYARSSDNGKTWVSLTMTGGTAFAAGAIAIGENGIVLAGGVGTHTSKSTPQYGYDTATQFRLPSPTPVAGVRHYIKAVN